MEQQDMKVLVGNRAADLLVKDGMKLGLGTGSTVVYTVRRVGTLLQEGKLRDIKAVSTSFQTTIECEKMGIPLYTLNSREIGGQLDLSIDGADEVDGRNYCTKGGGAALLLEKIVAYASLSYALVIDESKVVENLGLGFPIAVEVVPEARLVVNRALEGLGAEAALREAVRKAGPVITDKGNLILDTRFKSPVDPAAMETEINRIAGVVENGLFTRIKPLVLIVRRDGTIEERRKG
ncbi:MAG: ribose-5-phosphate isomerase RpiA [Spirochaetaceae bacterium]|jgi:ribose 5-phosphate isomerase A|nr:ribose-5-phosphate isomerase RpiA [Spirochaetaceae bacterium]